MCFLSEYWQGSVEAHLSMYLKRNVMGCMERKIAASRQRVQVCAVRSLCAPEGMHRSSSACTSTGEDVCAPVGTFQGACKCVLLLLIAFSVSMCYAFMVGAPEDERRGCRFSMQSFFDCNFLQIASFIMLRHVCWALHLLDGLDFSFTTALKMSLVCG